MQRLPGGFWDVSDKQREVKLSADSETVEMVERCYRYSATVRSSDPSCTYTTTSRTENKLCFILKIYKGHARGEEKFLMKASANICGYLLHKYNLEQ